MFVCKLSCLFRAFADSLALESVAMKAVIVMLALLLQKPKTRDHVLHLEQHLQLWVNGKVDKLLEEGCMIQRRISPNPPKKHTQKWLVP